MEMNSENLAKYHKRIEHLQRFLGVNGMPKQLIVHHCLEVVMAFYTELGLIEELRNRHRVSKGDLTEQEKIDDAELDKYIAKREQEKIDEARQNYEPVDYSKRYWADYENLAEGLLLTVIDGEEEFDKFFEDILIHRYKRRVIQNKNGERGIVYEKQHRDELEAEVIV